jgi:transcription elongation factor Elf1
MTIQKEWRAFRIMKDYGCPTCGSKNFGSIEMKKDSEKQAYWKKQCYNCKKFWHDII